MKRFLNRPGVQVALARMLVAYLKFALGTTRWTLIGLEHVATADRRPSASDADAIHWDTEVLPLVPVTPAIHSDSEGLP